MAVKYAVVENVPGYLPESEPVWFDTQAEAEAYAEQQSASLEEDSPYIVDVQAEEVGDLTVEQLNEEGWSGYPNNPADQIGEAAEQLEESAHEIAEAAVEAGEPEEARDAIVEVLERLADMAEEIEEASDEIAEQAEEIAEDAEEQGQPEVAEAATEAQVEAEEAGVDAAAAGAEAEAKVEMIEDVKPEAVAWMFRKMRNPFGARR